MKITFKIETNEMLPDLEFGKENMHIIIHGLTFTLTRNYLSKNEINFSQIDADECLKKQGEINKLLRTLKCKQKDNFLYYELETDNSNSFFIQQNKHEAEEFFSLVFNREKMFSGPLNDAAIEALAASNKIEKQIYNELLKTLVVT